MSILRLPYIIVNVMIIRLCTVEIIEYNACYRILNLKVKSLNSSYKIII